MASGCFFANVLIASVPTPTADYIGGTTPFLPASTRSAVNSPLESRWAKTKTCTPGCKSDEWPGSIATTGISGGIVIVCEPVDAPSLYWTVSDDPPPCPVTELFVIFEL